MVSERTISIPRMPYMPQEERTAFLARLSTSKSYLEYGAGGSTLAALDLKVPEIISIDSDSELLNSLGVEAGRFASSYRGRHINLGTIRQWGYPTTNTGIGNWHKYSFEIWRELATANFHPDLVLIDGRFRVACFLATLLFAPSGAIIFFDDFFCREYYAVCKNFLAPAAQHGRAAIFVRPAVVSSSPELISAALHYAQVAK
ncbi:MAG: hypothetical protein IPO13_06680 [Rhodocyclaceae bacterium]|nr:hypothetical protein [Rhodocyclaceae bacterium]